jgi:molybdate transport system regulatory protein
MKALPRSIGKTLAKTPTSKTKKKIAPKLRLWVVFDERVKFGDGRAQLLALIDQLGSIKNAVASTGMSYRAVWGYLKELETAAGFKFLERTPGSGPQSGARLTKEAKEFIKHYQLFRDSVQQRVETAFQRSFHRS